MKKRKLKNKRIICIVCIVLVFILIYIFENSLDISRYELSNSKITQSIRVVQITDLHGSFGKLKNEQLVKAIKKEEPDLILITGDLISYKSKRIDEMLDQIDQLLEELALISPVYISYGNHEDEYDALNNTCIAERYEKAGATVLLEEYQDIQIKGQTIRIGGTYGYCTTEQCSETEKQIAEVALLKEFEDTDAYKILMCHIPLCWIKKQSLCEWNVDCVFSGHIHGGQIQIPFVGGLYAPDQGLFPGKSYGLYQTTEEDWKEYLVSIDGWIAGKKENGYDVSRFDREYSKTTMVLSRGIGNTESIPRINNRPEIVVVDFIPE